MASTSQGTYVWQAGDNRWIVAGRKMREAGYVSSTALAEDIAIENLPQNVPPSQRGVTDWVDGVHVGQTIIIPHAH
ncbi:MAG: hypothetical protein JWO59_745 [Chloroflexi bacterium]|nr:hypothetical protein [Chloroflexota bacterium]